MSNVEATGWGAYYNWLLSLISPKERRTGCGKIIRQLFFTNFTYCIPNDSNRMYDGLKLRVRFEKESGHALPEPIRPCSVLEVLIALGIELADEAAGYEEHPEIARDWFWIWFDNLGLYKFAGGAYKKEAVSDILERWLDRKFDSHGFGSPFPVKRGKIDQRKDEMWHQVMNNYAENT